MLETVDLSKKLDKEAYKELFPQLRHRLWELQREAYEKGMPTLIVFEGWDASGKGDSIRYLTRYLDPRGCHVHPISAPLEEERLRPFLWRYWTKIPGKGQMAIFDRSWYGRVMVQRIDKMCTEDEWRRAYSEIDQFERQLVDDGTVIVKFWLHITKKEQRKRFRQAAKDPFLRWTVQKEDWRHHKQYRKYLEAVEEMLERTSTHYAPWTVVAATDRRFRRVKVFQTICESMQAGLKRLAQIRAVAPVEPPKKAKKSAKKSGAGRKDATPDEADAAVPALGRMPTILDSVDLSVSMDKEEYTRELKKWQLRQRELEFACYKHRMPVIIVYEGWDAGGKGGNIRRVTETLDPRGYSVIPIAAPTGDEKTHHYLWRFWRQIPKAGHLAIFDRSWYGRVMVERIEGFCTEAEWRRAFQEIREFERHLTDYGTVLVKFWLHISPEEQLRRFQERDNVTYKKYKLTDEDWRNRMKWDEYHQAVVDMLHETSTTSAPWTVVEGNCKYYARVKALRTIATAIEQELGRKRRA